MIDRKKLKERAKKFAYDNKWNIWGPLLLIIAVSSAAGYMTFFVKQFSSLISLAISPAIVGYYVYIFKLINGKTFDVINDLLSKYKAWAPIVLCSLVSGFFIGIGTVCLIIPGIIISIMLSQTFYILADTSNEKINGIDSLAKSKEMMEGHKTEYFELLLSFIGWYLLIPITLGIAAIWVVPYVNITMVMYYKELKKVSK